MTFLDDRLPERFWDKVIPEPNSGCWLWTGCIDADGYGHFKWHGKNERAHRVAFIALKGAVPDGLVLDHLKCSTTCCVNPEHLNPTTIDLNSRRSPKHNSHKTCCPRGHALSDAYRWKGNGPRRCRLCLRDRWRQDRRRQKQGELR